MSKLQILVPQYNEDEDKIKPLLDSIEQQQNIDIKNDIEVLIGNDGSNVRLSTDFLTKYSFNIQYHIFEHGRLAATRKKLFDLVAAPFVMWCDADDRFVSMIALSIIFQSLNDETDAVVCDFYEEKRKSDGSISYAVKHNNSIYVHGKVYRTQFLKDERIEWHSELHEHQDSAFNILALTLSKKTKYINDPLYMWCDNPESISRKNKKYHLVHTWSHFIDSNDALVDDFMDRGYADKARYFSVYLMYYSYYEVNQSIWNEENVSEHKVETCKRIADFYEKNFALISDCSEEQRKKAQYKALEASVRKKKKVINLPPFEEWLRTILAKYKQGD